MKKIISLVLAVLLCLGAFPLTVLAEPADPVNYVALSDSMGQGYMFLDYNENPEEGHYCGWKGTSERSYIKKFARDLEEDFGAVNFTDLTIQGLQPDEVCAFLESETFDFESMTRGAKKHIGWWTKEFVTDEEQDPNTFIFETFKDMSDYYIDAITNADVITYDIGMNYFGTFLTDAHGDNENYMDLMESKGFAVLLEVARRILLNELGNSAEAEELTGRILYSYMSYLLYTEECIGAIYKLNPDVKLILIPLANPHRELYVTVDGNTVSYSDLIDMMLDTLNDYIRNSGWYSRKYYFADLSGAVISFADELYFYPNIVSEDAEALLERTVLGNNSILGRDNYPMPEKMQKIYDDFFAMCMLYGLPEEDALFQAAYFTFALNTETGEPIADEEGNPLIYRNVFDNLVYNYIAEKYGEDRAFNDFYGENYYNCVMDITGQTYQGSCLFDDTNSY